MYEPTNWFKVRVKLRRYHLDLPILSHFPHPLEVPSFLKRTRCSSNISSGLEAPQVLT